ncbi:MAG TPA: glycosyltransferase family 4 protein [Polyangiaceae bacterium]
MNIAFLSWESLHSVPVGGVGVHVTELAAALQRRGNEVHVFARLGEGQSTYDIIDGVHYHRCPIELNSDFVTEMNNMCNALVYFMGQTEAYQGRHFDIVHGHDWLCSKGIVQAKNDRGRRVVLTLHSTEFGRCGNQIPAGLPQRIAAVESEGAFVADKVLTVSHALAGEVQWLYGVPDWKLEVVPNGVNCEQFDGYIDPGPCRQRYGIGPMDPMVLFAGRLCFQKGADLLLEAVPNILQCRGDAKIVFAGDGHMRQALEHRARELRVEHAVRFVGAIQNGQLRDLFKSTDVVCVPSRNEPFGIVVLEAWAAGKPCIVSCNGGARELVEHGQDGLVVNPDPNAIAWGVCEFFRNFEHARWAGSRGRVKAAYGYAWNSVAERTERAYHAIC